MHCRLMEVVPASLCDIVVPSIFLRFATIIISFLISWAFDMRYIEFQVSDEADAAHSSLQCQHAYSRHIENGHSIPLLFTPLSDICLFISNFSIFQVIFDTLLDIEATYYGIGEQRARSSTPLLSPIWVCWYFPTPDALEARRNERKKPIIYKYAALYQATPRFIFMNSWIDICLA